MNDFQECLKLSHAASDLPIWEQIYRKAFLNFAAMVDHRQNGEHQKAGIDRSVILSNGKQLLVDEKVRGRNKITGKVYDDVLLEYVSNDKRGDPGWVCKPLRADFIAYAIAPLGICHLLPVLQLQNAWQRHGDEWRSRYETRRAANNGYMTLNTPVPLSVLYPAIGQAFRVRFDAIEYDLATA